MIICFRKMIENMLRVILVGLAVFFLQGCVEDNRLQLVDGGIKSPVAEKASLYLPEGMTKNELDIFSYDTTAESLMELDIELGEEDVLEEYIKKIQPENDDEGSNEELPQNLALCNNLLYNSELDFYTGSSNVVAVSYDLSVSNDSNSTVQSQSHNSFEANSLDDDIENILANRTLPEIEAKAELSKRADVSTVSVSTSDKGAGSVLYYDVDSGKFFCENQTVEFAISEGSDIESSSNDEDILVSEYLEILPESNEIEIRPVGERTLHSNIDGVDSTAMLAQAEGNDDRIIRMAEPRVQPQPELMSDKNQDYQNDLKEKTVIRLTLAEALRLSLGGNPDVTAASYVSKQAKERLNASKTVYDPSIYQNLSGESNEDLDADYYYLNPSLGMNTSGWSIEGGVRQPLPTGGSVTVAYEYGESKQDGVGKETFRGTGGPVVTLRHSLLRGLGDIDNKTAIKVAKLNSSIAQADFLAVSMDSVYEVCTAYWTFVFYLEQMAIQKRVLAMAKEVYEYEKTRNQTGIARKLNTERAYSVVEVRRSALLKMRDNVLTALDQLILLIGNEDVFSNADLVLPSDRPMTAFVGFDILKDESIALSMRPELMKEYSGIDIGEARRRQAHRSKLPTLELQAKYGLGTGNIGLTDNSLGRRYDKYGYDSGYWRVGLEFNYQLGSRGAKAAYREAEAMISEKKAVLERRKREIKVEVRAAGRSLVTAQKNMIITFRARKSALEVLEGERVRLKLGLTTNEELLRTQEYYAEREIDYFRSIIDCNINALKLSRAKGTILSDLGVDVAGMRKY